MQIHRIDELDEHVKENERVAKEEKVILFSSNEYCLFSPLDSIGGTYEW